MTIGDGMDKIEISEFRAKCLAVLERLHKTKTSICITRHGTPVAEIVPHHQSRGDPFG